MAVIEEAIETFTDKVVTPALSKPRGEPRVRALFEHKLAWIDTNGFGIGCIFTALEQEYDDRPGPIRERLVESRREWHAALVKAVQLAVRETHFAADVDPEQLAFELEGFDAAFHEHHKFFGDPSARQRAMRAYERLVEDAKPARRR